jgi:hypothetical protein
MARVKLGGEFFVLRDVSLRGCRGFLWRQAVAHQLKRFGQQRAGRRSTQISLRNLRKLDCFWRFLIPGPRFQVHVSSLSGSLVRRLNT